MAVKKYFFYLMAFAIAMTVVFAACSKSSDTGDKTVAVTGLTLNQTTAVLAPTDKPLILTATVSPEGADNKNVDWTSSDPAVATVYGGAVIPMAVGATTITATTQDGSKTATCAVTVRIAVTGVTLNRSAAALALGSSSLTLVATVSPEDATNQNINWTSSDPAVATVADGVVTPLAVGTTIITVTTQDGNMTATCPVTVTDYDTGVVIGGVTWATRNVDAPGTFAASPEDPGMFYQWNSAAGWSITDPMISSPAGATWYPATYNGNGATSWESANDPCPAGWRVPTQAEHAALVNAGGVWTDTPAGRIFGSGDNTIFLPAAGRRMTSGDLNLVGSYGYYWSATILLTFGSSTIDPAYAGLSRAYGFSVRCVAQ